jgi:hypothetical protein
MYEADARLGAFAECCFSLRDVGAKTLAENPAFNGEAQTIAGELTWLVSVSSTTTPATTECSLRLTHDAIEDWYGLMKLRPSGKLSMSWLPRGSTSMTYFDLTVM